MLLVERRGEQDVSRGGGANRMLVEEEGANRMLVEVEGQTGC